MAAEPAGKLNLWDRKLDSTLLAATHKHLKLDIKHTTNTPQVQQSEQPT